MMQVVGVDSYAHEQPLGRLLQDALALPLFGGSNLGLRRRQLHAMLREPGYDADATVSGIPAAPHPRATPQRRPARTGR
jgi:hypothetical protein